MDILNQLYLIGKTGNDVRSIVVREDMNRCTYWYEIDWVNPPAEKPVTPAQPRPQAKSDQIIYPFKTAEQRLREGGEIAEAKERRRRQREEKEARAKEEERKRAEIEAINGVVIDVVRETTEQLIKDNYLKIELGEDGKAVILYRELGFRGYNPIDRENGTFKKYADSLWTDSIKPEFLSYFNVLAQQAEGQEVSYTTSRHTPEVCQAGYERALKAGLLIVYQDPEKDTTFYYTRYSQPPIYSFLLRSHGEMDLERNVVIAGTFSDIEKVRPIHPDFANFLRQKKIELDSHVV